MFIVCLQTTLGVHAVLPSKVGFYIISTLVIIIVLLIINDENVSKGLSTKHIAFNNEIKQKYMKNIILGGKAT